MMMNQLIPYGYYESYANILSSNALVIQPNDAYTWKRGYPQSCVCQENYVPSQQCSIFQCTCTCDITASVCDYGCCCDPDCDSSQTARFSDLDVCAPDGYTPELVKTCYTSTQLSKINPREPMGGQSTAQGALGDALCVYKKNYARKSFYFEGVDAVSNTVFDGPSGTKLYNYYDLGQFASLATDQYFDQNDTIPAYQVTLDGLLVPYLGSGVFSIPRPDFGSNCRDNSIVKYEVDAAHDVCKRSIDGSSFEIFSSDCQEQSLERYVSGFRIGSVPTAATTDTTITPTVGSVYFEDPLTGVLTDISQQWKTNNCSTGNHMLYSLPINNNCVLSNTTEWQHSFTNHIKLCSGIVRSLQYTVSHASSGQGTISSVVANVVLTDIYISDRNDTSKLASLDQSFSVSFQGARAATQTTTLGNTVRRHRSGNPGYLFAKPILAGTIYTKNSTSVIKEITSGLVIPSPLFVARTSTGTCPTSSHVNSMATLAVQFGVDVSSGCVLDLNRLELEDYCSGSNEHVNSAGIPYFYSQVVAQYIGLYGNADPSDISQWIEMAVNLPARAPAWDDTTAMCTDMVTGLDFKFLVMSTGEKSNPQNKIVSAVSSFSTSNMQLRVPVGNNSTKQAFSLSVRVNFIFAEAESMRGYNPPAPPVLFRVPWDAFYPFLTSGSSMTASMGWHSVALAILMCSFALI